MEAVFDGTSCHAGFFGKLPARGDFVRAGLPSSFVTPWDEWMARMLAASQRRLGGTWIEAWLQAPVWCFAFEPGVCGPDCAIGLWMPSVDRVGRNYPLVLAAVVGGTTAARLVGRGGGFLDEAEAAGLAALEDDLDPDRLAERVGRALQAAPGGVAAAGGLVGRAGSGPSGAGQGGGAGLGLWWTEGSPIVPPAARALRGLPGEDEFARMIDARVGEAVEP